MCAYSRDLVGQRSVTSLELGLGFQEQLPEMSVASFGTPPPKMGASLKKK